MIQEDQYVKFLADLGLKNELHQTALQLVHTLGEHVYRLMDGNEVLSATEPIKKKLFWYNLVTAGYLEIWQNSTKTRKIKEKMRLEGWDESFLDAALPICHKVMEKHCKDDFKIIEQNLSRLILRKSCSHFLTGLGILILGLVSYYYFPDRRGTSLILAGLVSLPFFTKALVALYTHLLSRG